MITITYDVFKEGLVLFGLVCVAVGWLIKIIKGMKKPADDINEKFKKIDGKLNNDNERLNKLDESLDYIIKSNNVTLQAIFVILGELAQNNDADGKIAKMQDDLQHFLLKGREHE